MLSPFRLLSIQIHHHLSPAWREQLVLDSQPWIWSSVCRQLSDYCFGLVYRPTRAKTRLGSWWAGRIVYWGCTIFGVRHKRKHKRKTAWVACSAVLWRCTPSFLDINTSHAHALMMLIKRCCTNSKGSCVMIRGCYLICGYFGPLIHIGFSKPAFSAASSILYG